MMKTARYFTVMGMMFGALSAAPSMAQQAKDNSIVTLELPADVAAAIENNVGERRDPKPFPAQIPAPASDLPVDWVKSIREAYAKNYYALAQESPPSERTEYLTLAANNRHAQAQYEVGLRLAAREL